MRYRVRALLIAALIALSGAALAQGLGFGLGMDDLRGGKGGPPAVATFWLWNTNGKIIWNTNGKVQCNACP
jgi:hypothetical protein